MSDGSSDTFETIQWSFDDETGIGRIVLDRPDVLNALSLQMRDELEAAFERFRRIDDDGPGVDVRVVVIKGAGDRSFCVGSDINEIDRHEPGKFTLGEVYDLPAEFGSPVVAKIDGYCIGGGLELALACDFRFASEGSQLGFPEIHLGIIPGGGGTQRLAQLIGPCETLRLLVTGEFVSGSEAAALGVVNKAPAGEDLDDAVAAFTETVAGNAPLAVRAAKDVMTTYNELDFHAGRRYERRASLSLRKTEDHAEGVDAWDDDRDPEFVGR
jgi:enoyl-CoA hydratase/carnithine racemase